jgi:hypothetical protein
MYEGGTRLEEKKAVCRTSKFGNAHVFEAVVSRDSARHRMIDDLVALFGGRRLLKTGAKIAVSEGDSRSFPGIGFSQAPGVTPWLATIPG